MFWLWLKTLAPASLGPPGPYVRDSPSPSGLDASCELPHQAGIPFGNRQCRGRWELLGCGQAGTKEGEDAGRGFQVLGEGDEFIEGEIDGGIVSW